MNLNFYLTPVTIQGPQVQNSSKGCYRCSLFGTVCVRNFPLTDVMFKVWTFDSDVMYRASRLVLKARARIHQQYRFTIGFVVYYSHGVDGRLVIRLLAHAFLDIP